jgi:hypothetical protein
VQDAVGVVSVGDLQIVVKPKIPTPHLLYLFSKALQVPRLEDKPGAVEAAAALWELVARWFIRSMLTVIRRDLSRDYHPSADALQTVRGRVDSIKTARSYYAGRVELHCEFDDFTVDTPLNRVLPRLGRSVEARSLPPRSAKMPFAFWPGSKTLETFGRRISVRQSNGAPGTTETLSRSHVTSCAP